MKNDIKKYCDIVRNSSNENEKAILDGIYIN